MPRWKWFAEPYKESDRGRVPVENEYEVDEDPVALARRVRAAHEVNPCTYCYDNGDCRVRFWADDTVREADS